MQTNYVIDYNWWDDLGKAVKYMYLNNFMIIIIMLHFLVLQAIRKSFHAWPIVVTETQSLQK